MPLPPTRLLTVLTVFALSAGCHRSSRVDRGNTEGIMHFANDAEPADLDPNTNIDSSTEAIDGALFEGLVGVANDGHTTVPGVAQSWDLSSDGLVYTFHLRAAARWSNGAPVTADDFLFSFRRVFDPQVACEESSFGFAIAGSEDCALGRNTDLASLGLAAPDPGTFVIRLAHPAAYFLSVLGRGTPFLPVYRPSLEKFGGVRQRGAAWTREGNLVGNGPFLLTRWVQNQVIEVRRNPSYWDAARVPLNGVNFYPVDDEHVQELGFRSGQFHVATKVPLLKAASYDTEHPGTLRKSPTLGTHILTFNVAVAPFTDARVRRAFSMAFDRAKLCQAVYRGFAEPAYSQVLPGTGGFTPAASYGIDPEGARHLLAEAGFPGGRGFPPVDLMLVGNDAQTVNAGEVLQAAWREVLGVAVNLAPTEKKVYLDAERTKHYQVMMEKWDYPWDDPSAYYQVAQSTNPNNDSGWADPAFDQAYRDADLGADPALRRRAFMVQEERLAAGVPYAPVYFWEKPTLVQTSVRGWNSNPLDHIHWAELSLQP